jgi:hypothetical protein
MLPGSNVLGVLDVRSRKSRWQLKVAQVFNLLYRRIASCRPGACVEISETLNSQDCALQRDQMAGNGSDGLQVKNVKNLRYSPADAGRYAFGLTSTIEAPVSRVRSRVLRYTFGLTSTGVGCGKSTHRFIGNGRSVDPYPDLSALRAQGVREI